MKIIHVNQQIIRHNGKYQNKLPPLRIQDGSKITYCRTVEIKGESRLVYQPDDPLSCGAKLWIETDAEIHSTQNMTYKEIEELMEMQREDKR